MEDIVTLRRILTQSKVIAIVGLSANWYRPSFFAAKYLQDHGYRIIPVNPRYDEVLGETCYSTLESVPEQVDVVDIFQHARLFGDLNLIGVDTGIISAHRPPTIST